jgi:cytochrome c oxidase subunit 2
MAAEAGSAAPGAAGREPNHGLRIFLIWLPLSVAADLILYFVYGPHMPPGLMSNSARSQQFDILVLSLLAAPVVLFVLTYGAYALIVWRHREGDDEDGPPIRGNNKISATWITVTAVIVLFCFGFGTYELIVPAGAGAGEGPSPIWTPNTKHPLIVQVVAQQWKFTFRYPQFGGFETNDLVLPDNQWVQFDVTSIDVIHSFWAYQLGVKADANPGVNNVAYTKPDQIGEIRVECAELCGLWHGAMFDFGHVVTISAFRAWAAKTRVELADVTKMLPPFATTYDPTVVPQISKAMAKAGITGAAGLYYPGPPYTPVAP